HTRVDRGIGDRGVAAATTGRRRYAGPEAACRQGRPYREPHGSSVSCIVAPVEDASVAFVLALGRALHRYGTPAHRLEEGLKKVCDQLEVDAEVFTTPTAIIMSFGAPTELRTRMMRVEGGELDMSKLARVDTLVDDV